MGGIRTALIKRTSKKLLENDTVFSNNFDSNKKLLGNNTMSSKKVRNKVAGYMVRLKNLEKQNQIKTKTA